MKFVKHIFKYFISELFFLVSVISLFGCSAQSENLTNVIQTANAKPSPEPLPISANLKASKTARYTFPFVVKGVSIGTPYKEVLNQLGKPLSNEKSENNDCGISTRQILRYSGLTITLNEGEDKKNIVILIEINSSDWEIGSGISVGASSEYVQAKFGQPDDTKLESDLEVQSYFDGDGAVDFYFRNKKLIKITRDLNLC